MKPSDPMGDLAAQASDGPTHCKRCNAALSDGESRCPRCGLRVHSLEVVENDASTAQSTLARANVLRMRGELAEATELCLTVLQIHPENVEAHVLLGDIYFDKNQKDHAAQWYELALELDPNSGSAQDRLRNLEADLRSAASQSTQQVLGVSDPSHATNRYAVVVIAVIAVFAVIAFIFANRPQASTNRTKISDPIQAIDQVKPKVDPPKVSPDVIPAPVDQDGQLRDVLAKAIMGDRILSARIDPRNNHVTATYNLEEDPTKLVAAEIATSILEIQTDCPSVTVRLAQNNRVTYMADVRRLKLDEFNALPVGEATPEYMASFVIENEWTAPVEPPASRP